LESPVTIADWVIVAVIVVSVIQAVSSGFFHEAFGMAGLIFGYMLAAWNYDRLAARFAPYLKSMWLGELAAFLVIFLAVMILAGIAGRIARWLVQEAGLSSVDRVLGGALGLLRGCLIVAVVAVSTAAFTPAWLQGSALAPYFLVVGRAAIWVAPSELRARFYQGLDLLHRDRQHI
jgi:membrane protein required for colicin V production